MKFTISIGVPRKRAATRTHISATLAALVLTVLAGCTRAPQADPRDAPQVALGKTVYASYCAACHGANLEGQGDWKSRKPDGKLPAPPHDADGHTWHHDDQTLIQITKFGLEKFAGANYRTDMPKYTGVLSDEQVLAVLAYIKSTWPKHVQERQSGMNRQ